MKSLTVITTLLISVFLLSGSASAFQDFKPLTEKQKELIEKNILANLTHRSIEVRANTIQLIIDLKRAYPEMKLGYAVVPLMNKLKNAERCEVRILAALALNEYDSDMARYAIERRALFDDSKRVCCVLANIIRSWETKPKPVAVVE